MTTATDTTIAAVHASQRIEGTVSITGTIIRLDRRHTAKGDPWTELLLADRSSETIPVLVFPRLYPAVHQLLADGASIRVTGLLDQTDTRLEIYATAVEPNPDLPDWEH